MRRAVAAAALLLGSACSEPEPPPDPYKTPAYREWRGGQMLRQVPAAGFAPTVPGRLDVDAPENRSKRPDDFCELYLNGEPLAVFRVGKMADGSWPRCGTDLLLRTGPNWIDLFDTSSNRSYRHQIDTREGTVFTFTPTAEGYELVQSKKE